MNGSDARFEPDEPGIGRSFKAAATAFTGALQTRLELFSLELEEEREHLKQTLFLALLGAVALGFGIALLTIFLVAVFWHAGWISALGFLAAVYLAVGIGAGVILRRRNAARPPLFSATLGELAKDRDRLRSALDE